MPVRLRRRRSQKIVLIGTLCLLILLLSLAHAAESNSWPTIRPLARTYRFNSIQEAKLKTIIRRQDGKPEYILECHAYPVAPRAEDFVYSGDFECRLHSYDNKDSESTLLTELPDATRDWESRGRFLAEQLVAPCDQYEDLGRRRSFQLRGFRLKLNLSNIAFDNDHRSLFGGAPALRSFELSVVVESDPAATSSIASTPSFPPLNSLPEPCQKAFGTVYLDQFREKRHG